MEIEYKDERLLKVEEGGADNYCFSGIPLEAIEPFRKKINFLRAAPDEKTIREWKSLRYEKLKGKRKNQRSIRLNEKWRLIFTLESKQLPPKIIVFGIEDYH